MGKRSILKKHHKDFLELVVKEPYLLRRFYWTGGTALSEFYLRHRESYDVDLFSEKEIHFDGDADGWRIDFLSIHYEGPDEFCEHCGIGIPSAYGDPDED